MTVRTRIAPSPTGDPHVGTAYVALFNRTFAHKHGGQFLLRIEDTDQARSTRSSEEAILSSLRWLGLEWDEGPDKGGPHGPYRQSERTEIYRQHAAQLIEKGAAYRCFCSKERLDALRAEQQKNKVAVQGYDRHCLGLPQNEVQRRLEAGEPYTVRLRMPDGETRFFDVIRKKDIIFDNGSIDDQILLKGDGFPTYHLANVVDDHLMQISHVIRGEEWINSTPKHIVLYEAFGWEKPVFAHLPLLRNKDKSKVSKRKNPVSLTWFRAAGYLPAALLNFLGLMGWSLSGDRERFTPEEMREAFELEDVKATGPVFDMVKLDDTNAHYVRDLAEAELRAYLADQLSAAIDYTRPLLPHIQQRTVRAGDFLPQVAALLQHNLKYPGELLLPKKGSPDQVRSVLKHFVKALKRARLHSASDFETWVKEQCELLGQKQGDVFMILRVALFGARQSLPLWESLEFVGQDALAARLKLAQGLAPR